jgi:hypothetical protein
MKIIFSRKGWDSSAGGKPSPIFSASGFPSGNGFSIPIPDYPPNPILYRHLTPSALAGSPYVSIGAFLGSYAPSFSSTQPAHLDPDLEQIEYHRSSGWTPCFGQENGAASHLTSQGVRKGDLFIFYGWFDDVNMTTLRRSHSDRFCVFGYLQIDDIFLDPTPATTPSWLHYHPHITHRASYSNNRIYVASSSLTFPSHSGISLPSRSGGGILNPADSWRCLTTRPGKRGLYPGLLLSRCPTITKHRQEHVWQPKSPNDWQFVANLLR